MSLTTFYRRISLSDWLDRAEAGEAAPLLGRGLRRDWRRRAILAGLALLVLALVLTLSVWAAVGRAPGPSPPGPARAAFSLLSLSVWGCPASFGCPDKKERIAALGRYLAHHGPELVVLQELWMRPDHEVVRAGGAAAGYSVTAVGELAPDICDGRVLPSFCSGLAVLSRLPVLATQFTAFTDRGSFWSGDGEYWARKGVGRVRVEVNNKTVDVFSTSLAASDDNVWYRQRQAGEFGRAVAASTADIVIAAGNFESDPRSSETTYRSVLGKMSNTALEVLGPGLWPDRPSLATWGNPANSYTGTEGPLVYDYLLHRAQSGITLQPTYFSVKTIKSESGLSLSNHDAIFAKYSISIK